MKFIHFKKPGGGNKQEKIQFVHLLLFKTSKTCFTTLLKWKCVINQITICGAYTTVDNWLKNPFKLKWLYREKTTSWLLASGLANFKLLV